MKTIILVSENEPLLNAVSSVLTKNNFDVKTFTHLYNLFNPVKVGTVYKEDINGIYIDKVLTSNKSYKSLITQIIDSDAYKNIPVFEMHIEQRTGDNTTDLPDLVSAYKRNIYFIKYKNPYDYSDS